MGMKNSMDALINMLSRMSRYGGEKFLFRNMHNSSPLIRPAMHLKQHRISTDSVHIRPINKTVIIMQNKEHHSEHIYINVARVIFASIITICLPNCTRTHVNPNSWYTPFLLLNCYRFSSRS